MASSRSVAEPQVGEPRNSTSQTPLFTIRHLANVASVVPFQHVDQSLHAAAGHAFLGIWTISRVIPRGAGEVRKTNGSGRRSQDRGAASPASRRFFLVHIQSGAGNPILAQGLAPEHASSMTGPLRCVDHSAVGFILTQSYFVDQVIGWAFCSRPRAKSGTCRLMKSALLNASSSEACIRIEVTSHG